MKTTNKTIGFLLLFVVILSVSGTAVVAEDAVLWPSDALSKVMRSDIPKANSKHFALRSQVLRQSSGCIRTPLTRPQASLTCDMLRVM